MTEFFSHRQPDILLKDHLKIVGQNGRNVLLNKRINNLDIHFLADVAYLIGISHDFGKFTQYFQDYLNKKRKGDGLTHHGLISALFTYEVLSEFTKNKKYQNNSILKYTPLLGYFIVKHHHGNLDDIRTDVNSIELFDEFRNIKPQLSDIRKQESEIKTVYSSLFLESGIQAENIFTRLMRYEKKCSSFNDLDQINKVLRKDVHFFSKEISEEKNNPIVIFLVTQLLYSILIDADKKHAGHVEDIKRYSIPQNIVDRYKARPEFQKENISNITKIRNDIYDSVINNVLKNSENKIFSITAPTGTGKTLTSLSAALKLRNRITPQPRIIYALPFTSIIDQNFNVFDDVFQKTIQDFKNTESAYLLKHHHLAEFKYKYEGENKPLDESLALIETWDSEIVVTTFIQFFYSTIGYKNKFLKKFHNIAGSIIILDEVQNIPIKYWKLVGNILLGLTEYFNCTVILLTATQPLIFQKKECVELVEDYTQYFSNPELNRVELKYNNKERTIEEVISELTISPEKSYMFVLNTIRSSIEFYNQLSKKMISEGKNSQLYIEYLSTNIIPKVRRERIMHIKKDLDNGKKMIIVTTQLIEAGVDIDVDVVFRDIAPLDSIIQVAGRCNRKKRVNRGEVRILNLIDQKKKRYSSIYDKVLLNIVYEILNNYPSIEETHFLDLINMYFNKSQEKMNTDDKIIKALFELNYQKKREGVDKEKKVPISEFKLIEDNQPECDVFIELDDNASKIWRRYLDIQGIQDLFERKKKFLEIKKEFYEYVISIPPKDAKSIVDTQHGINRIPKCDVNDYYDSIVGFIRGNPVSSIFG